MGNVNQSFNDRVRYSLEHKSQSMKIQEPDGWNDDEKEYARNEDYHGIFAKFSNSLKFVGESANLINEIIDLYGIQTDLRLSKEERHPHTDVWTKVYDGYLDLSTWQQDKNSVSVKFNSGGLEEVLKSRESEDVELSRLTSIDGDVLEPMSNELVEFDGRRIFLKSLLQTTPSPDNYIELAIYSNGNTRSLTGGIPLKIITKSHEEISAVPNQSLGTDDNGGANMMFFLVAEVDRVLDIKLNLDFRTNCTQDDDINSGYYQVNLAVYKNGSSFDIKNRITLFEADASNAINELGGDAYANPFSGVNNHPALFRSVNWSGQISLLQGESLAFETLIHADMGDNFSRGHFAVTTDNCVGKISIDENSIFSSTTSKFFLPHEYFDRLAQIMTGKKDIFKSIFLGRPDCVNSKGNNIGYANDGIGALTGLTHGFWVRGFDALPISTEDQPNRFKPLTTNWKNAITAFDAIWNIGLGIEKNGYTEKIIIEDLRYFYNRNVTIKLPFQVKNVKRTIATKYYYSGIEIGYDKGGDYQEATGLDEYNGKSTFTTLIKVITQKFVKVSGYRADSYGKEFCRRKPFVRYSTEDTTYDDNIFVMDLKRGDDSVFKERKWQDDFSQIPIGTYSPETATNLRFSPFNMMLRHGWQIMAGLVKYPTDYIRYGSSTANSALRTKLRNDIIYATNPSVIPGNGNEYVENGNILNSELAKARYVGEFVEFEHLVSFEINQKLEGFTIINGEKVFNFYGLIQFINENNKVEKGWLMSLKPNKEGKWQVLKFNKI